MQAVSYIHLGGNNCFPTMYFGSSTSNAASLVCPTALCCVLLVPKMSLGMRKPGLEISAGKSCQWPPVSTGKGLPDPRSWLS